MINKFKLINNIKLSFVFFLISSVFLPLQAIDAYKQTNLNEPKFLEKSYEEKVAYKFYIPEKLEGTGEVEISVKNGNIIGVANGIGTTSKHEVDFKTDINGKVTSGGDINVDVLGIGTPECFIPGKVTFSGPLMGVLENNKLKFFGKVLIKGRLAAIAGFDEEENLQIEFSDPTLVKAISRIQKSNKLASL